MTGRTPTKDEWDEWLTHPCTKALRAWAAKERQELMEMWAGGSFSAAFTVEMAVKNAGATGACSIHAIVAEMDYQQIVEANADAKPIGT